MSITDRLKHNLSLKLLSMAIALLIWGLVHNQADPLQVRHRAVPVEAVEVPEKLAVAAIDPNEVTVTLFGRASAFDQLDYSNFRLIARVAGAPIGVQTVPVEPADLPAGLELRSLSRTVVRVELDSIVSATRPVFAEMRGDPAPGFAVSGSSVSPISVTVSGPASRVQEVARVVAEVDVSGRNATLPATVSLSARDAEGVVVAGVRMDPPQASVTVRIRQINSKTVPVVPILTNVTAGYEIGNISVTPVTVTLAGAGPRLSAVNAVQTGSINLDGERGRRTFDVPLRLPEGITAIGGSSASVTVELRRSTATGRTQPGRTRPETPGAETPEASPVPEATPEPAAPAVEPEATPATPATEGRTAPTPRTHTPPEGHQPPGAGQ